MAATGVSIMRDLPATERPLCPKCRSRMNIIRVVPGAKGQDAATFGCAECNHILTAPLVFDPMKSDSVNWLKGELKPPV